MSLTSNDIHARRHRCDFYVAHLSLVQEGRERKRRSYFSNMHKHLIEILKDRSTTLGNVALSFNTLADHFPLKSDVEGTGAARRRHSIKHPVTKSRLVRSYAISVRTLDVSQPFVHQVIQRAMTVPRHSNASSTFSRSDERAIWMHR
ncbi:uncharacterized protein LOC105193376 [Solenopsis invicta]|uniref:uncharacterized protein LOC105193376 n=1 Tax=Solenopsis invicta TaxID=13686 RepID=UPI00193CBBFF|nr:uncharacterized protein LOC105193376 [Solenopsis invicta]XP_039312056.1 uncharacterized protein LOC105193376 [Solenopsis invicta]